MRQAASCTLAEAPAFKPCAVIPAFNHYQALPAIIKTLVGHGLPVFIVDDGSSEPAASCLQKLGEQPKVHYVRNKRNAGKGAALMHGFALVAAEGFTHALQVDADGQHDVADTAKFLQSSRAHPEALISGCPVYDQSVPGVRFYGRYLTHAAVWFYTLSTALRDSMCGFRVYPLEPFNELVKHQKVGTHMDFDTDIMVRLWRAGTPSRFIKTHVHYPVGGTSNYRMLRDNARMLWLHMRLLASMPQWLVSKLWQKRQHRPLASKHWAHMAERGSAAGIGFLSFVDRYLGRSVAHVIMWPVVIYFMLVQRRAQQACKRFLLAVGQSPGVYNRFRQLRNFADAVMDKAVAWRDFERLHVDLSACGDLMRDVTAGRGVMLITSHMGNMEAARAITQVRPDLHIHALVHSKNSVNIHASLERVNADYSLNLLQVSEIGGDTVMMLRQKIAAGDMVVIAGDRVPVDAESPTIEVPFLGTNAPFAVGPYVLAHVLECPVHALFCMREDSGYKVYAEAFADKVLLPRQTRQQALRHYASAYADCLASYARRFPLQWYNFFDLWAPRDVDEGKHDGSRRK